MWITPKWLLDTLSFPAGEPPIFRGLGIFYEKEHSFIRGMDSNGFTADTKVSIPELMIMKDMPSPKLVKPVTAFIWWDTLFHVEQAVYAILQGNIKQFGKHVDAAYAKERAILESNIQLDLAYAAARSGGAYGGYPSDGCLAIISENYELLKK